MFRTLAARLLAAAKTAIGQCPTSTQQPPDYVSADIQQLRDSRQSTPVTILATPTTSRDQLHDDIAAITDDPDAIEPVGTATLRATVPEHTIDDICALSSLKSIDIEHDATR